MENLKSGDNNTATKIATATGLEKPLKNTEVKISQLNKYEAVLETGVWFIDV